MADTRKFEKVIDDDMGAILSYIGLFTVGVDGKDVEYIHYFSLENDAVYLVRPTVPEDNDTDHIFQTLLIYHHDCEVYDMSDKLVGTFFVKDDHWHYRDLLINPTQETRCFHVKGAESLLESELLFSKHWIENHQKVKHDEKDNERLQCPTQD